MFIEIQMDLEIYETKLGVFAEHISVLLGTETCCDGQWFEYDLMKNEQICCSVPSSEQLIFYFIFFLFKKPWGALPKDINFL